MNPFILNLQSPSLNVFKIAKATYFLAIDLAFKSKLNQYVLKT